MKSILQEASSVAKAIGKAWDQAGQPREFTVKILEMPEKGFLGFTKNPAVLSVIYKQVPKPRASGRTTSRSSTTRSSLRKPRGQQTSRDSSRSTSRPRPADRPRVVRDRTDEKREKATYFESWEPELVATMQTWLNEMMNLMKCTIKFDLIPDDKVLTATFESPVIEAAEEEGMLFASFSFLLIQSLKKKHKNKFKGFRFLLTSNR